MKKKDKKIEEKLVGMSKKIFRILRKRGIVKTTKDPVVYLSLVPNSVLRRHKRKLLHKDVKVVDVLAFPEPSNFPHPETKNRPVLGEVLINVDIAGKDFSRAVFLLIHGILHLLGYRHTAKRDIIVMEKLEQEILIEVRKHTIFNF